MKGTDESLQEQIRKYSRATPEESVFIDKFLTLLNHPDAFLRTHLPGHITGSVFIVSEDFRQALLVHHARLNRWLQPGGHADGDPDTLRVALREGNEETGLKHLTPAVPGIFDIDIHPIPARKELPQHDHYDVRYLVTASPEERIVVSEESHDVKWVLLSDLEKYNNEKSILRMRNKLQALFPAHRK